MASQTQAIYWDACAWIGFINDEPEKMTPLRSVWRAGERGRLAIWTSTYSYLEVIHGRAGHGQPYPPEESDVKIFSMFDQAHVKIAQLDTEVAKLARHLKRQHHSTLSKRSDAIHLATALYYNVHELHTWDNSDLLPLSKMVHRRDGEPLIICVPATIPSGELFDDR